MDYLQKKQKQAIQTIEKSSQETFSYQEYLQSYLKSSQTTKDFS